MFLYEMKKLENIATHRNNIDVFIKIRIQTVTTITSSSWSETVVREEMNKRCWTSELPKKEEEEEKKGIKRSRS